MWEDSVRVGLYGGQCEGGLMWGHSVKVGLYGGQCYIGLNGDSVKVGF